MLLGREREELHKAREMADKQGRLMHEIYDLDESLEQADKEACR